MSFHLATCHQQAIGTHAEALLKVIVTPVVCRHIFSPSLDSKFLLGHPTGIHPELYAPDK